MCDNYQQTAMSAPLKTSAKPARSRLAAKRSRLQGVVRICKWISCAYFLSLVLYIALYQFASTPLRHDAMLKEARSTFAALSPLSTPPPTATWVDAMCDALFHVLAIPLYAWFVFKHLTTVVLKRGQELLDDLVRLMDSLINNCITSLDYMLERLHRSYAMVNATLTYMWAAFRQLLCIVSEQAAILQNACIALCQRVGCFLWHPFTLVWSFLSQAYQGCVDLLAWPLDVCLDMWVNHVLPTICTCWYTIRIFASAAQDVIIQWTTASFLWIQAAYWIAHDNSLAFLWWCWSFVVQLGQTARDAGVAAMTLLTPCWHSFRKLYNYIVQQACMLWGEVQTYTSVIMGHVHATIILSWLRANEVATTTWIVTCATAETCYQRIQEQIIATQADLALQWAHAHLSCARMYAEMVQHAKQKLDRWWSI